MQLVLPKRERGSNERFHKLPADADVSDGECLKCVQKGIGQTVQGSRGDLGPLNLEERL